MGWEIVRVIVRSRRGMPGFYKAINQIFYSLTNINRKPNFAFDVIEKLAEFKNVVLNGINLLRLNSVFEDKIIL